MAAERFGALGGRALRGKGRLNEEADRRGFGRPHTYVPRTNRARRASQSGDENDAVTLLHLRDSWRKSGGVPDATHGDKMPASRRDDEGRVRVASIAPDVHLDLPAPPGVNALWLNVRGRGRVRTPRYRKWLYVAGWELRAQRPRLVAGPVAVTLAAGPAQRQRDLDGLFKATFDLLEGCGVIENDGLVREIIARWDSSVANGRMEIEVRAVAP